MASGGKTRKRGGVLGSLCEASFRFEIFEKLKLWKKINVLKSYILLTNPFPLAALQPSADRAHVTQGSSSLGQMPPVPIGLASSFLPGRLCNLLKVTKRVGVTVQSDIWGSFDRQQNRNLSGQDPWVPWCCDSVPRVTLQVGWTESHPWGIIPHWLLPEDAPWEQRLPAQPHLKQDFWSGFSGACSYICQ